MCRTPIGLPRAMNSRLLIGLTTVVSWSSRWVRSSIRRLGEAGSVTREYHPTARASPFLSTPFRATAPDIWLWSTWLGINVASPEILSMYRVWHGIQAGNPCCFPALNLVLAPYAPSTKLPWTGSRLCYGMTRHNSYCRTSVAVGKFSLVEIYPGQKCSDVFTRTSRSETWAGRTILMPATCPMMPAQSFSAFREKQQVPVTRCTFAAQGPTQPPSGSGKGCLLPCLQTESGCWRCTLMD